MKFIISEVIKPLTRRGGTAAGAYLVGIGVQHDAATTIVAGLTALAGVLLDLILSHKVRKA